MEGIVKLVGIILVACGTVYFVKPALIKKIASFFSREKWIYVGGIISFIIGLVFLRAASQCAISWFVTIVGIIAFIKGILVFVLGQQKIKTLFDTLIKKPPKTLRLLALVDIALGVMIIYAV